MEWFYLALAVGAVSIGVLSWGWRSSNRDEEAGREGVSFGDDGWQSWD